MNTTTLSLHPAFQVGPVDERVFGGFLEHLGRAVYGGVFQPGLKQADADGFRTDTMAAMQRLQFTAMRWPWGNFASGYHWMDGVGPQAARPTVRDLAWQSLEPNRFGTDEFIRLCGKMAWTPMITVNLGTGSPEEARNWVEYCNCPAGTRYADLRGGNGSVEPFGVKLWCLGNEMDGRWQLGHVPAEQYAIRAQQAAKMMKDTDRSIELVACGSCGTGMGTYMEWDRAVMEYMGDLADYVSLHRYVGNSANDSEDFLAVTNSIDRQIEEMDAACRFVQARRKSRKRAYLCFDEWNVWYKDRRGDGEGKFAPHLLEEVYNLEDALVVSGFLHSFLRHADAVKIANLAQIVNVIAPILTDDKRVLLQSIFYPLEMFARRRKGVSLRCAVEGPSYEGKTNGRANYIDTSAILDGQVLHVFATNRSLNQPGELRIELADARIGKLTSGQTLCGKDPKAANSFHHPDRVKPQEFAEVAFKAGTAVVKLPSLSVTAMSFKVRR